MAIPTRWLRGLAYAVICTTAALAYANDDDDNDRGGDRHHGDRDFRIEVLSGRADMVAGGDALVRVTVKKKQVGLGDVRIELNNADVTALFKADSASRSLTGLVTGLRLGENRLEVDGKRHGRGSEAELKLVNYPIEGPIISGPHEQPYACATQQFNLPAGLGNLGAALDANCSINRRVDYIYRTTANAFAQWPAGATTYPANIASTTTTLGKTVPYIIRIETGTINRAIYQITILHDPLKEPAPSWSSQPGNWNKRLIYTFG